MLKRFLIALACLLAPSLAFGQANVCINGSGTSCAGPFTGTAITQTGYNFAASGPLLAPPNAVFQGAGPFSVVYGVKTTTLLSMSGTFNFLNNTNAAFTTGFSLSSNYGYGGAYALSMILRGVTDAIACDIGTVCWRLQAVNDGNWHSVCQTFNPGTNNRLSLYIDAVLRDSKSGNPFTWTPEHELRSGRRV